MSPFSRMRSVGPQTICDTPPGPDIPAKKGVESAPLLAISMRNFRTASLSVSPISR